VAHTQDRHAWKVTTAPISAALAAYGARPARAFGSVVSGMESAEARADNDASNIATNGPDASSMVDLVVQRNTYSALAAVFRTSAEMNAAAVDLLA
jgi:hypothetical protein